MNEAWLEQTAEVSLCVHVHAQYSFPSASLKYVSWFSLLPQSLCLCLLFVTLSYALYLIRSLGFLQPSFSMQMVTGASSLN